MKNETPKDPNFFKKALESPTRVVNGFFKSSPTELVFGVFARYHAGVIPFQYELITPSNKKVRAH